MSHTCPCCGYKTLSRPGGGTFELCPVCDWEDDSVQLADPDYEGGANGPSLRQAQSNFQTVGASDIAGLKRVKPRENYELDTNWKPLWVFGQN